MDLVFIIVTTVLPDTDDKSISEIKALLNNTDKEEEEACSKLYPRKDNWSLLLTELKMIVYLD